MASYSQASLHFFAVLAKGRLLMPRIFFRIGADSKLSGDAPTALQRRWTMKRLQLVVIGAALLVACGLVPTPVHSQDESREPQRVTVTVYDVYYSKSPNQPRSFAAPYDSREDAERVAQSFRDARGPDGEQLYFDVSVQDRTEIRLIYPPSRSRRNIDDSPFDQTPRNGLPAPPKIVTPKVPNVDVGPYNPPQGTAPLPRPSLQGAILRGSENLQGYSGLTFSLYSGDKAVMRDARSTEQGAWSQNGNQITLTFFGGTVVYRGVLNGNSISGSATNGRTSWSWGVSR
jgi:hypothetical protein